MDRARCGGVHLQTYRATAKSSENYQNMLEEHVQIGLCQLTRIGRRVIVCKAKTVVTVLRVLSEHEPEQTPEESSRWFYAGTPRNLATAIIEA